MYLFFSEVEARSDEEGRKKVHPIFLSCERFAKSIGSHLMFDIFPATDGTVEFRVIFDIKGTEHSVLEKVAALFSFVTVHKFRFGNQFYYPEKAPESPLG